MARNRKATEQKILKAVGSLLARGGFRTFGINAVARQARVDKVLIYRYFGGMPDLLRAYAEAGTYWRRSMRWRGEIRSACAGTPSTRPSPPCCAISPGRSAGVP